MENKITDNEIIKALECCTGGYCVGCPLDNKELDGMCVRRNLCNALDLINRQKAEIERLQQSVSLCNHDLPVLPPLVLSKPKDEVAEIKSKAIKEFVEQIHVAFRMYDKKSLFNKGTFLRVVDEIKEEMVGDE